MISFDTQSNINKVCALLAVEQLRTLLMHDEPQDYDATRDRASEILAAALVVVEARGMARDMGGFDSCINNGLLEKLDLTRDHIVAARRRVAESAMVAPF